MDINDSFMIDSFRNGDNETFRYLISTYKEKVFNIVISIVGNDADATDVTQNVFVKVFSKRSKFKGNSSIFTWIYRIAVNESLNMLKKNSKKVSLTDEDFNLTDNSKIDVELIKEERKNKIENVLKQMPRKYKVILVLKEIEGLSYNEISNVLKISLDKVKIWLYRARNIAREIGAKEGLL